MSANLRTPLDRWERLARVRANIRRFGYLPQLQRLADNALSVALCGFSPSLADTWREVVKADAICTTSGAHDFLLGKGVVPRYHVECDPREHKAEFVRHSHPAVTYLINSACHPAMFELLWDRRVVMWHGFTDDAALEQALLVDGFYPGARLMGGGTNVGMRALPVLRERGHRAFELHGMDCCYRGEAQWAGEHHTAPHKTVLVEVEGERFETSDLMMQSTDDFFLVTLPKLPGCRFRVHGGGLLEARLKLYNRDRAKALSRAWWRPVGFDRHGCFGVGWRNAFRAAA